MATLPTFDELHDLGRAEAMSRKPDLTDWSEGSGNDALVGAGAVQADQVIRVVIDQFAALFLDTAEGQALYDLAADRFGLAPHAATPALVMATWTRSAPGAYSVPAGTRFRAKVHGRSVVFASDVTVSIGAGEGSVQIAATAVVPGREGNVAPGTLTEILDTVPADPGATLTNADRASGGAPAEPHSAFRDRVRRYYPTLRRGTPEALRVGALSVPGVSYATVDEAQVESHGHVLVYVGDPDGAGNELLAGAVAAELEGWRAAGIRVLVQPSSREEVTIELSVRVRPGVDTPALETAILAAGAAHVASLPPNATLYLSQLDHAALGVSPDVLDAVVSSHSVNLEPAEPKNAIRLAPNGLTIAFVEVKSGPHD